MIDYAAALAVTKVIETGSFEKAARALNVTPSAISQRVRQLEDRLGTVLVVRGTPPRPTAEGALLCRHLELVGLLERDLLEHLPGLEGSPGRPLTLDIAVNADSLATWFLPAIAPYSQRSGHLFNIAVDDQDHTAEWLRTGRVLAAVTALAEPVTGCIARPLGNLRYHATASPEFCRTHFSGGVTAAALATAPALTFNQKDGLQHDWAQRTVGAVPTMSTHWLPSSHGFVDACLLGLGWGLNPTPLVREHLASGQLVELVPEATLDIALYWQIGRRAAVHFGDLTEAIETAARQYLVKGS